MPFDFDRFKVLPQEKIAPNWILLFIAIWAAFISGSVYHLMKWWWVLPLGGFAVLFYLFLFWQQLPSRKRQRRLAEYEKDPRLATKNRRRGK